ncbi:potassium-transporting ATPase subunit KdpA [Dyadobacter sp. OTU695]|uniref:potassium-transporting ATPase subunit KdpA n=1 Tax=Dyadobacter sp. OTU695 TaxID=3043860 RepID=UPI00313B59AC
MDIEQLMIFTLLFGSTILLAWPLGKYVRRVFSAEPPSVRIFSSIENRTFKFARIDPNQAMSLGQYLRAFLTLNLLWVVYGLTLLLFQGNLPLNPDGNPSMEWTLALHSAIRNQAILI